MASRKRLIGFARLSEAEMRRVASKGGVASHVSGHAHEFTSEEASRAGKLGGAGKHKRNQKPAPDAGQ